MQEYGRRAARMRRRCVRGARGRRPTATTAIGRIVSVVVFGDHAAAYRVGDDAAAVTRVVTRSSRLDARRPEDRCLFSCLFCVMFVAILAHRRTPFGIVAGIINVIAPQAHVSSPNDIEIVAKIVNLALVIAANDDPKHVAAGARLAAIDAQPTTFIGMFEYIAARSKTTTHLLPTTARDGGDELCAA